jgi:protocatechuate 3,4-dioxygenase beta subunit
MKRAGFTRRDLIEKCMAGGLLAGGISLSPAQVFAAWREGEAKAMTPTPSDILGPFFKKGAPNVAALRKTGDAGLPLRVTGTVFDARGERVPHARIDVWHADAAGVYDLEGFRYRGKVAAGESAEYAIETVMPGHYDDRPAQHIHYLISAPGHKPLITQAYFATDPFFEGDPVKNLRKRGIVTDRELVRPVTLVEQGARATAAITFDVVLERA